ncbi:hypothetical protein C8J57DRAFT_1593692 [Mycena rebaudengoi]|nr:hypothetical protein C8J57DRAFT_1593692 [Mycena rebaudengoi]
MTAWTAKRTASTATTTCLAHCHAVCNVPRCAPPTPPPPLHEIAKAPPPSLRQQSNSHLAKHACMNSNTNLRQLTPAAPLGVPPPVTCGDKAAAHHARAERVHGLRAQGHNEHDDALKRDARGAAAAGDVHQGAVCELREPHDRGQHARWIRPGEAEQIGTDW